MATTMQRQHLGRQHARSGYNPPRRSSLVIRALFGKKKPEAQASNTTKEEKKKESVVSQTLNAFDFSAARSKKDAELLYEAKYGKRGEDGKMTREQYAALRRKIGGTARDYWKDWVEEEAPKNIKTYYKPDNAGGSVPYLPFLVGVLLAVLGATVVVVQKTGGAS